MSIYLYGEQVSGNTANVHFIEWSLRLENEHAAVPHNALDANKMFQQGAYRHDVEAGKVLKLAGIEVR